MEKFERQFKEFLEKTDPENSNLKEKVMGTINRRRKVERFRKAILSTLIVAIVFTFGLSFVAPVFGKAGTLPQLIKSVKIESTAKSFEGVIEIDETILQKITDANLSFADAVVISALSKDKNIDIDKVIEMRKEGFSWGKILDTLNATLNENDIKGTDVTNEQPSNSTNNNSGNQTQTVQSENEQNKNENKNANQGETTAPQNKEQETEQEQNENELIIVIKGTVSAINGNTLTISGETVTVNDNTTIKYLGKSVNISQIKVNNPVLVHAAKVGDSLVARDIILYKNTPGKQNQTNQENKNEEKNKEQNESQSSQNEEQNQEQNSQKEFELNTVILSVQEGTITLKDFTNPVIVDDSTKVEQVGAGRVDKTVLKEGQTVQIHIRFDGTNYKATQIIVQEKAQQKGNPDSTEETNSNKPNNDNSNKGKKP